MRSQEGVMIARLVKSWSITQSGAMISLVWAESGGTQARAEGGLQWSG